MTAIRRGFILEKLTLCLTVQRLTLSRQDDLRGNWQGSEHPAPDCQILTHIFYAEMC